jgi:ABC-2 type transport system ATP-binding protein
MEDICDIFDLVPDCPDFNLNGCYHNIIKIIASGNKNKIDELSTLLGIDKEIFRPIKTFSGGMKRKLEIVRSLIHEPKVLFLDEPTVGLDPASRRNLWQYIRQVRQQNGTTVFLTTHYLDETEDSDTICIINKGRVVATGTPDEVKAKLVHRYLIIDAADRAALRTELTALGLAFEETPQFKVTIQNDRAAHQLLKAINTPLTRLKTHTPTVEDAYLAIVGEQ